MEHVTARTCKECGKPAADGIEFGHAAYQDERFVLCRPCLTAALAMVPKITWAVSKPGTRTTKAREEKKAVEARLHCGFGHSYNGTVRGIAFNSHDQDGDASVLETVKQS